LLVTQLCTIDGWHHKSVPGTEDLSEKKGRFAVPTTGRRWEMISSTNSVSPTGGRNRCAGACPPTLVPGVKRTRQNKKRMESQVTRWFTDTTYPYRYPFHRELLKKTRRVFWYLGGTRSQRNINEHSGVSWPLCIDARDPAPIDDERTKQKEFFSHHRCQYHDCGKYFGGKDWTCYLIPDRDMAYNQIRCMRQSWVIQLWWEERKQIDCLSPK
jgi:hypothetical protein